MLKSKAYNRKKSYIVNIGSARIVTKTKPKELIEKFKTNRFCSTKRGFLMQDVLESMNTSSCIVTYAIGYTIPVNYSKYNRKIDKFINDAF